MQLVGLLGRSSQVPEVLLPDPDAVEPGRHLQGPVVLAVEGVAGQLRHQLLPDWHGLLNNVVGQHLGPVVGDEAAEQVTVHQVGQLAQVLEVELEAHLVAPQQLRYAVQEQNERRYLLGLVGGEAEPGEKGVAQELELLLYQDGEPPVSAVEGVQSDLRQGRQD